MLLQGFCTDAFCRRQTLRTYEYFHVRSYTIWHRCPCLWSLLQPLSQSTGWGASCLIQIILNWNLFFKLWVYFKKCFFQFFNKKMKWNLIKINFNYAFEKSNYSIFEKWLKLMRFAKICTKLSIFFPALQNSRRK